LTGEIYYSISWFTAAVCTLYWKKCPEALDSDLAPSMGM
jgi:hypothetical protein